MTSNHRHGTTGKYALAGDIDKTDAALAARVTALEARCAAIEKEAAVTKALLLAATGGGSFNPPVNPPAGPSWFIAPAGSDSNDGTIGSPWASIQKFIDTNPAAGSTLYLRGGNYSSAQGGWTGMETHGNLIGTAEAPITIRNYPSEVPTFVSPPGQIIWFAPNATSNTMGVNYVVLDGIRFTNCTPDNDAVIAIGGQETVYRLVKNITIRNVYMSLATTTAATDNGIAMIHNCENITIEDCTFVGPGGAGQGGSAVTCYSTPAALNVIVRRCVITGWNNAANAALLYWDEGGTPVLTGQIVHCSFINNDRSIDIRYHSTMLVQDCAFDEASGYYSIYDPYNSASTTLAYNFYSQTFDANYYLVAGQTGRSAASDGLDAGALDW